MAAEDIFTADSADITLGEPAEVVGGTDAAEPVPIEEIIAHKEEVAEQVEHGSSAPRDADRRRREAAPATRRGRRRHGRPATRPDRPGAGDEAAARRDSEEQA